eukprot:scaffold46115_cov66-Phaeocystis_antarctica.AAC.3
MPRSSESIASAKAARMSVYLRRVGGGVCVARRLCGDVPTLARQGSTAVATGRGGEVAEWDRASQGLTGADIRWSNALGVAPSGVEEQRARRGRAHEVDRCDGRHAGDA